MWIKKQIDKVVEEAGDCSSITAIKGENQVAIERRWILYQTEKVRCQ